MQLRLSQKLAKKIKAKLSKEALSAIANPFDDWHVRVFSVNRIQYIMVTNTASLYTVMLFGKGINNKDRLIEEIGSELLEYVSDDIGSEIFRDHLVPTMKEFQFSKSNNRSVIGSMNDFVVQAECHLIEDALSPSEMARRLNRTPMSMLKYKYPIEAFLSLCGMEHLFDSREVL